MNRVEVVSDGGVRSTRVYLLDDEGNRVAEVSSVQRVDLSPLDVAAGDPMTAEIRVVLPRVALQVEADVVGVCPYCGHEVPLDLADTLDSWFSVSRGTSEGV